MASIEYRGGNSYRIIVSVPKPNAKGYRKERKTIELPPGLTEKQKQKELEKEALLFEEIVKKGDYLDGEKITLAEFVEIWLKDYAEKELAPSTLVPYRLRLEKRILPALGHLKLARIQPHHITAFYNNLAESGMRMNVLYKASEEFAKLVGSEKHAVLSKNTGLGRNIFARLRDGKCVYYETAQKLSSYFNVDIDKYFIQQDSKKSCQVKLFIITTHYYLVFFLWP